MKSVDATLDWGGRLYLVVGDAVSVGDELTVCLLEASATGRVFQIAEVVAGPNVGTFYGKSGMCPASDGSGANLKALGETWYW